MPSPYVAKANQYIADVLSGAIPACKQVRQACQRQVDDLAKHWEFEFSHAAAHKVCAFIEALPHVKGEWAKRKELIKLEPWQCFILTTLFGWIEKDTGLRRFRELYAEVPRKNTKSTMLSGIGNFMLSADGEEGSEVYCGAGNEKQANEVFRPALKMWEKSPELREDFGVSCYKKSIAIESTNSFFQTVIGKPGDGSSPHCGIVDEYHEHDDSVQFDCFETGMGSRSQPLLAVITTAGVNMAGPCYSKRNECIKLLNGDEGFQNDRLFCVVYTVDQDDDWTEFEVWKKANPNYGVSVNPTFLEGQYRKAMQSARRQNIIKTKHLNMWCGAKSGWINIVRWDACADESLTLDDFKADPCWLGLDLANKTDVCSIAMMFKRSDEYYLFVRNFLPEETADLPENQHYREYQALDSLTTTDGAATDYEYIAEEIEEIADEFNVQEVGFDPWNASFIEQRLTAQGMTCVEVRQGARTLSEPMKELEVAILQGRLHHDGDPMLRWMVGNVVAKTDDNDNIRPVKDHEANKIDGAVASIIAFSRAMVGEEKRASIYESRGLIGA